MRLLLDSIARGRRFKGRAGEVVCGRTHSFREIRGPSTVHLEPSAMRAEQSNTSIIYGDKLILKIVRRADVGVNPDLEVGQFLTERTPHVNAPRVAGYIGYQRNRETSTTLAILKEYMHNEGSAWDFTCDFLVSYYERVLSEIAREGAEGQMSAPVPEQSPFSLMGHEIPPLAANLMGGFVQSAEQLGRRTGELHSALASSPEDLAFAPEPLTPFYQRSIYQGMRALLGKAFPQLRRMQGELPEDTRLLAEKVLSQEDRILERFHRLLDRRIGGARVRIHGDFHLGQVLYTGKDFVIIDFEGEPSRPLGERRLKRSPLRDVAGMLRSFQYAAYSVLEDQAAAGMIRPEQYAWVEGWARYWCVWTSAAYLRGYLSVADAAQILPQDPDEIRTVLNAYLLDKAVYEVHYELNHRPDWVKIPLTGMAQLLESAE
jgi:maltose alpha-D-glucosyltransferase/alpha-amylase